MAVVHKCISNGRNDSLVWNFIRIFNLLGYAPTILIMLQKIIVTEVKRKI